MLHFYSESGNSPPRRYCEPKLTAALLSIDYLRKARIFLSSRRFAASAQA